jgi:hypothetical protein
MTEPGQDAPAAERTDQDSEPTMNAPPEDRPDADAAALDPDGLADSADAADADGKA